ncbi:MAG: proton-conducting transporter membrane subunit [Deferrisomatales bacterium]|nr:proton-conducting transporter membrane subunit [Deferrisomatales bacterium]
MPEQLVILGALLLAASGLPGLVVGPRTGPRISVLLAAVGALAGLAGAGLVLAGRQGGVGLAWAGHPAFQVDALSALFLCPVFLVTAMGNLYGLAYWTPAGHPEDAARLRAFYGVLGAAMAVLLAARDGVLFLTAWEVMALAAFFLLTSDDGDPEVRGAGWVYLVATHLGTLCLFLLFGLVAARTGSLAFPSLLALDPGTTAAVFLLALVGFGLKAGLMPFHVWLPGAHANAPSHVSALMSGVVIKMGIYGLLRATSWVATPPAWWGWTVLALGGVSAVLGVAYAVGQHDLKRLLAYHSVENIGIIALGVGLALLGRARGEATWMVLGLGGALLHVWNHGLFKPLLFLSAGSVIHATGTREIDAYGGLWKSMPRTGLAFLVGAVAICGLPPLNGFVSELLVYLGLFRTAAPGAGGATAAAALAVPALALVGALALACFVKAFGAVFLGEPRTERAREVHGESPAAMTAPMAVLALLCVAVGLAPWAFAPALDRAVAAWSASGNLPAVGSLVPLAAVSGLGCALVGLLTLGAALLWRRLARSPVERVGTWDCGYAFPTARMQYTSSSFARTLVGWFAWALRPEEHRPRPGGCFPEATAFWSHVPDAVLRRLLLPAARAGADLASRLRVLQQGNVHAYVAYILATVVALLAWG